MILRRAQSVWLFPVCEESSVETEDSLPHCAARAFFIAIKLVCPIEHAK